MERKETSPVSAATDDQGLDKLDSTNLSTLPLNWPKPGDDSRRPPPAFQEYAHTMLSNDAWRSMTMAERGLLVTLRYECWANGSIAADTTLLSRVLHIESAALEAMFTTSVRSFFRPCDQNADRLHCPELTQYMGEQLKRRALQRASGAIGGQKSVETRKKNGRGR